MAVVNLRVAAKTRTIPNDNLILALVCLAQFMVILDISVVNVALPSIRQDLHFSQSGLQWVVNAYTLAFAGFLMLGGRAADLFGRRRVFLAGIGLFTAASLAGGLAPNQTTLIAARIAQGLGGAILSPATLTILTTTFSDPLRRARALGAWSAMAAVGGAAGSLLGGILTDVASWRWTLFINVPAGVLAIIGARALLPRDSRVAAAVGNGRGHHNLDALGAVLVTGGLMALVYAIVGTDQHPWTSDRTLGTLAIAVVLLGWFVFHEARVASTPLMPLSLFRSRSVSGANLVMLCMGGGFFAMWFFLSLYMQNVLGYSPLKAGLAFVPMTLAIAAAAQVGSRLLPRMGARPLLLIGPLVSAVALLWLSRITADGTYLHSLLGPSVLATLGLGLAFAPVAFAATAGVPREQAGLASGLLNTTRQVGGAIGLAALATVATTRSQALLASAAPLAAITAGYARALVAGAAIVALAAAASFLLPAPNTTTGAATATPEPEAEPPRRRLTDL
jgi:EmrB/QacA subfamily drug resistance transporter